VKSKLFLIVSRILWLRSKESRKRSKNSQFFDTFTKKSSIFRWKQEFN